MLEFLPVAAERAADLERFSVQHDKFRYCSCMRWRMTASEYKASTKESRIATLAGLAQADAPVGVLAYRDGEPVGWCAIAPRDAYGALERAKALQRVDEEPVWSVVCFFVDSKVRGLGITVGLLRAAVNHAVASGARIVEGYPVEPEARLYTYMGSLATFREAGFRDVTPPGRDRRVMRFEAKSE